MSDRTQHEAGPANGCVECEVPQLARNHYFTGKLLVERDFTDEQRYFVGKDRRHDRFLHGRGTVCGLTVAEHPNPACRAKYLIVRPGLAIDCCGREIIVRRDETFDFRSRVEEILLASAPEPPAGEEKKPDDKPHQLQICIRYRECGDEDIPALFDDCGCGDGGCQPNRIVESFELDVMVDPERQKEDMGGGLSLAWKNTVAVSFVQKVVLDEAGKRLWVLGELHPAPGELRSKLYVFSLDNFSPISVTEMEYQEDFDVSRDGKELYLGGETEIAIYDAATFGAGAVPLKKMPTGRVGFLKASVEHTFFALIEGRVIAWNGTSTTEVDVGGAIDFAVTSDGKWLFAADVAARKIAMVDTAKLGDPPVKFDAPAGAWRIAVATTTDGMRLAVADASERRLLYLFSVKPGDVKPFVQLGDPYALPTAGNTPALLFSPGGRWVYVPGVEAPKLFAVDAHAIALKKPRPALAVDIGLWPKNVAQRADGRQLFAGFAGVDPGDGIDPATPAAGGVAVIDVKEEDCRELFDRIIEPCPECGGDDCLVLATIDQYVFGDAVDDAEIDNLRDRPLLPSTSVLTEVVKCLAEHGGAGERGPQGPPGENGTDGKDGKDGKDGVNGLPGQGGAAGLPGKDGKDGKDGLPGKDGKDAVPLDLPRIVAINWRHGGSYKADGSEWADLWRSGLVIAFEASKPVLAETLPRAIELLIRRAEKDEIYQRNLLHCWCSIPGLVEGVNIEKPECGIVPLAIGPGIQLGPVNGARFQPIDFSGKRITEALPMGEYMVVIHGDQVLGERAIEVDGQRFLPALDANHIAPYLTGMPAAPALGTRCPTGNRTEGGTFRSWFHGGVNINDADVHEIAAIVGNEAIARAIVEQRTLNGFITAIEDLANVRGIGPATLNKLRESTTIR